MDSNVNYLDKKQLGYKATIVKIGQRENKLIKSIS